MTIEDVLFFDTETTGIPDRSAKWDVDFNDYPRIVQIAWMIGEQAESHIIRPEGWEIPEETVAVHGITTEYALATQIYAKIVNSKKVEAVNLLDGLFK